MSGYDLVKAFESSLAFFWHAQNSHIYLELKKLEKKGFIRGETVIQSERPNKMVFSITDAGREAFLDWLAEGEGESALQIKNVFLMKIFFSGNMPPAQCITKLQQFQADCEAYLECMQSVPASIEMYGSNKDDYQTLYWQLTADFGFCFIKTCIEWAQRCIAQLEEI